MNRSISISLKHLFTNLIVPNHPTLNEVIVLDKRNTFVQVLARLLLSPVEVILHFNLVENLMLVRADQYVKVSTRCEVDARDSSIFH